jgi:hypothetical protein
MVDRQHFFDGSASALRKTAEKKVKREIGKKQ